MRFALFLLIFLAACSPAIEPTSHHRLPDDLTITGLAAVPGGYAAANDGRMKRGDAFDPSLVHLDATFRPLREDTAASLGLPATHSAQGAASSPEGVWVAWLADDTLRLIRDGQVIRTVRVPFKPNGLAMTPEGLAVSENRGRRVRWIETGRTISLPHQPDQLAWHRGSLWYSWGANGEPGRITELNGRTYKLAEADSIEGFVFEGDRLIVANDGYFHDGKPKQNAVLIYPAP